MLLRRMFLAALLALPLGTASAEDQFIVVQSTTSTEQSGLFGHILPLFKEKTGIDVRVVAVGTGQAIKNATNGDGDVLFVHAKPDEEKFVADGPRREALRRHVQRLRHRRPEERPGGRRRHDRRHGGAGQDRRGQGARSPRAATTAAPTRPSSSCGRRPASTPRPPAAPGTARPAPAWGRR